MTEERHSGFLHRWSRRKIEARESELQDKPPVPEVLAEDAPALDDTPVAPPEQPAEPALPTMDDVRALTADSDFSRFVIRGVAPDVKNAALKKLFADPHYNVMDGLDTYIDDYSQLAPLPESALRKMAVSKIFGFFEEEARCAASALADGAQASPAPERASAPDIENGAADAGGVAAPALPTPDDSPAGLPSAAEPVPTAGTKP
ncbi:DUF3306 domain-containing protein [Achromobacter agilis]|uniref:DUF3306 domain-containing protein n=1 Tax=Achromobacter agilis TaxID=1353888 RepID=A0A446CCZ9_9BURK|nr:DUF3306 domain-containing protein [Achromobacter agilis]SSW65721.1 hypothetical protein AGI3411_02199 [Achromobacter agilis]